MCVGIIKLMTKAPQEVVQLPGVLWLSRKQGRVSNDELYYSTISSGALSNVVATIFMLLVDDINAR